MGCEPARTPSPHTDYTVTHLQPGVEVDTRKHADGAPVSLLRGARDALMVHRLSQDMVSTLLAVTLCVTLLHLSTGQTLGLGELGDDIIHETPDPPEEQFSRRSSATPQSLGELIHAALLSKEYLGQTPSSAGTTTSPTQAVPPVRQSGPSSTMMSPGILTTAATSSGQPRAWGVVTSSPSQEETTTTLITTTTITTVHTPVQCNASLSGVEGIVESPDTHSSSSPLYGPLECTYTISVYRGYGVEIQVLWFGVCLPCGIRPKSRALFQLCCHPPHRPQVKKVNLSKEESLTILGLGGVGPELLANETLMSEGQVIRSSTNQVQVHYRSLQATNHGIFSLHYQAFLLSCPFPRSPEGGGVTVTDLHPGGQAHFHCDPGFQVRGHEVATCLNSTRPHWSSPEPQCVGQCPVPSGLCAAPSLSLCPLTAGCHGFLSALHAASSCCLLIPPISAPIEPGVCLVTKLLMLSLSSCRLQRYWGESPGCRHEITFDPSVLVPAVSCGGWIRNATVGRILSPPPPSASNHSSSSNLSCHWLLEAREGHRLHLHFERMALDEDDDRLIVRSGNNSLAPLQFDSDLDDVPERGIVSEGSALYLELTADSSTIPLLLALRYEAFDAEHCYEPYLAHGNFSSSDISFALGTTVSFSCSPGFVMEQGSGVIECVDPSDPHWNESEPVCRALCGGELSDPSGTVLSPDWPQSYSKGQDCVWQIHVNEDKRIELDIRILNIRHNDVLTIFDGHDFTSHVIGQYLGSRERFRVVSGGSEVTIQFQSDPDDSTFILSQGFLINYREVERNDTCPPLPPIEFGWRSSSHPSMVRGSVMTYQCQPGYDIIGSDIITCQWDLSWSNSPPTCQKVQQCSDPGEVVNGARSVHPEPGFAVGTVVRFSCNQGYQLEGPSQVSCHGRDTGTPKWSDRSPKCVLKYDPCPNPGVPDNGYQTLYKHSYQAGESLRFFCYEGYELIGEVTINCVPGHPSQWNSPPPFCKVAYEELLDDHKLEVSRTTDPSHQMDGENIALAIFLPIILVIFLIGGIYMYYTNMCRFQWKPLFWKSLSHTHSYSPITVESDFNNPLYEAGDTREYEVSI
ncbi:seizure 6-like protein 2-like [Scleropages formosus]|uniref:Seizure 6-like protein 2 n=1 Tax=Scleropages formosus TaxID=113540 RepID=A0A0N8JX95_SCLFO|nr:seizure 6-like protein 2-like [Scleropages formosus]